MNEIETFTPAPTLHKDALWQLADAWHAHLDTLVAAGEISPVTRTTYKQGFDRFVRFLEWSSLPHCPDVSSNAVMDWLIDLRARDTKPATINTWLAGVRALFKWAQIHTGLAFDPTAGIRGAKRKNTSQRHRREILTDIEIRMVLQAPPENPIGKRDAALLYLMAFTAARTVELWRADVEHLKTEQGRLVLYVQGKGRSESDDVIVIANPTAQTALYEWLAVRGNAPGPLFTSFSNQSLGARLSLSAIRHLVKRYYRRVGVQGANKTTHSLRHTAATSAIRHGATVQQTQAMLRHANIATTMIYFHETERLEYPAEQFIDYGPNPPEGAK